MKKEYSWILNEKYEGLETDEFKEDIKRLKSGTPVDYIIGNKPFLSCVIDLSKHPLIPREETEYWVEKVITSIKEKRSGTASIKCLDIFAGSGCIGVAILRHLPLAHIDFAENNIEYIEQIKQNITLNKIDLGRTHVIQSDVFSNIESTYDFIFANPPYISKQKIEQVQNSVLDNEPHGALFAENDGLYYIKKLIDESFAYLNPGGTMFIEFDSWQKDEIKSLLESTNYTDISFMKDQYDKWRVVTISKPEK